MQVVKQLCGVAEEAESEAFNAVQNSGVRHRAWLAVKAMFMRGSWGNARPGVNTLRAAHRRLFGITKSPVT